MAKKAATKSSTENAKAQPEKTPLQRLAEIICRSQGVGIVLAESIATGLSKEQQEKVLALAEKGAAADVILSNLANPKPEKTAEPDNKAAE